MLSDDEDEPTREDDERLLDALALIEGGLDIACAARRVAIDVWELRELVHDLEIEKARDGAVLH